MLTLQGLKEKNFCVLLNAHLYLHHQKQGRRPLFLILSASSRHLLQTPRKPFSFPLWSQQVETTPTLATLRSKKRHRSNIFVEVQGTSSSMTKQCKKACYIISIPCIMWLPFQHQSSIILFTIALWTHS